MIERLVLFCILYLIALEVLLYPFIFFALLYNCRFCLEGKKLDCGVFYEHILCTLLDFLA